MKLTYEFVKGKFEEKGYSLLSNYYINSKTKLDYICPKGHRGSIRWNDFKTGYGCPYCAGKVKLTIEFIRVQFKKEGYILISNEYINKYTKLEYTCPKGHKHSTTWGSWRSGGRCPYCAGQVKPTFEFVKASFESEGYTLLSKEYKSAHTKLNYICPRGHRHSISWKSWKNGHRCWFCSKNVKPAIDFIKSEFEKEGYILLSTEYLNNKQKLEYICSKGHKSSISWTGWKSGCRCRLCVGNNIKHTIEFVSKEFEKEGYKFLSKEYINANTKLEYKCPFGHKHNSTWANWVSGCRCPTCANIAMSGSGNPSWQGGKSFEEYCPIWKDSEFKSDIRERDGNKCLNPYCDSDKPNDLTIHHIDYDKKDCHPKNLITVCRSCNGRANKDRRWHKAWYQAILNKRYNYKY